MNKKTMIIIVTISAFFSVLFDLVIPFFLETDISSALKLLCYFTVQSNVIVFGYFLLLLINNKRDQDKFHIMFGGVLIYIFITSAVFIIFLERIYDPTGFRLAGSVFAHYITPALVITYFINQREYYNFKMEHIKYWFIYPLLYMVFVMIYGASTGDFLYPFLTPDTVGLFGIITAMVSLVALFSFLSFLVVKMVSKE